MTGTGTFHADTAGLTFTPVDAFTGTATADYRVRDAYGQTAAATYTVTVTTPPPPRTAPTSGVGTTPQATVMPVPADGTIALLDSAGNPVTVLTIAGKGT